MPRSRDYWSGAALLAAAVGALAWANSPWPGSYRAVWNGDVRLWVNDGLMTLFFVVAGMEIKRELVAGELRDRRTAALPVVAALGGMAAPALLYVALAGRRGWAIPMATDIAFALAVLAVVGRRAPPALRVFLLTLAVVDDIGAIVVIAVFYAGHVNVAALAVAVGLVGAMVGLRRSDVTPFVVYAALGVAVWAATYASGVHATVAGVALGLAAPVRDELDRRLVGVVTFGVLPVFALANAGVRVGAGAFGRVTVAVMVGLIVGKLVGISGAVWLAVRAGLGRLPAGSTFPMVASVAAVGGVGFTVSLFVTELAFAAGPTQDAAKVGVLAGSALAAVVGGATLRMTSR